MEKNKPLMIGLSCAIGSGIGVLLAAHYHVFWWVGVLVGGLAGYLVYDIKHLIAMIPIAWKYAVEAVKKNRTKERRKINWKSIGKDAGSIFLYIYGLVMPALFVATVTVKLDTYLGHPTNATNAIVCWVTVLGLLSGAALSVFSNAAYAAEIKSTDPKNKLDRNGLLVKIWGIGFILRFLEKRARAIVWLTLVNCLIAYLYILPRSFFLIAFYYLPKEVLICIKRVVIFACRFIWKFIKLIHSDVRMIVAFDSMVGGTIGHFCHDNIWIGMLTGAVFGVVNYLVIALWAMKLKPRH